MRTFVFFLAGVLTTALSPSMYADVMLSIDYDAVTPGIQNSITVNPGQAVSAGVVLELTGATSLSAYQFTIEFDRDELQFTSRSETPPAGFGFLETDTSNVNNLAIGQLYRFGADTGNGPTAPAGPFTVAQLQFIALAPIGDLSDFDIRPLRLASQGDDFLVNTTFATIPDSQLIFTGASVVTAIPEPGSLFLLLGAGVATFKSRRRRS